MSIRILLDQNVPRAICLYLERQRPEWLIRHVGDVGLWGAPDAEILRWAQEDRSVIITFDEDFADARMYPVGSHAGVIRLRVWPTTIAAAEEGLGRVLRELPDDKLSGSLIIVDEQKIRVRRSAQHG